MYFRWKDRRIVVELAVWAAEEGVAPQVLHTLADATKGEIESGEAHGPDDPDPAVGIPRNDEPVRIDESDRTTTLYFWHPEGEVGYFEEVPIDYKLMAPEAPYEGNRAFEQAIDGASGVLMVGSEDVDRDDRAFEALAATLGGIESLAHEGADHPFELGYVVPPDSPRANREGGPLSTPEGLPDVEATVGRPWDAGDVWDCWIGLVEQLGPRLRHQRERGRIPVD